MFFHSGFTAKQKICLDLIRPFQNVINTTPGVISFYLRRFNSSKVTKTIRMHEFQDTVSKLVEMGWLSMPVTAFPKVEAREISPTFHVAFAQPCHPEISQAVTTSFVGYLNDMGYWLESEILALNAPNLDDFEYVEFELGNFYQAILTGMQLHLGVIHIVNVLHLLQQGIGFPYRMLPLWENLFRQASQTLQTNTEAHVFELFLHISMSYLGNAQNNDLPLSLLRQDVALIQAEVDKNDWGKREEDAFPMAQLRLQFAAISGNDGELESATQLGKMALEAFLKGKHFEQAFISLSLLIQIALKKSDGTALIEYKKHMAPIFPQLKSARIIGEYYIVEADFLVSENKIKEARVALKKAEKQFKIAHNKLGQAKVRDALAQLKIRQRGPIKQAAKDAEMAAQIYLLEEKTADFELARYPLLLDLFQNQRWEEVKGYLKEMEAEYHATSRVNILYIVTFFRIVIAAITSDVALMVEALQQLAHFDEGNIRSGLFLAANAPEEIWMNHACLYLNKTQEEIRDIVAQEKKAAKAARDAKKKPPRP